MWEWLWCRWYRRAAWLLWAGQIEGGIPRETGKRPGPYTSCQLYDFDRRHTHPAPLPHPWGLAARVCFTITSKDDLFTAPYTHLPCKLSGEVYTPKFRAISSSLGYIPRVELLGYFVVLFNFLRNPTFFFTVAIPFYIPTSSIWGFQFSHFIANICHLLCCFLFF